MIFTMNFNLDTFLNSYRGQSSKNSDQSFGYSDDFLTKSVQIVDQFKEHNDLFSVAANNHVVNTIGYVETRLKSLLILYSNWNELGYEMLLREKITLNEAHQVFKNEAVTRERILAHFVNLQNFESINSVFSKLIGADLYSAIEEIELIKGLGTIKKIFPNWRARVSECYNLRNRFVHEGIVAKFDYVSFNEFVHLFALFIYSIEEFLFVRNEKLYR